MTRWTRWICVLILVGCSDKAAKEFYRERPVPRKVVDADTQAFNPMVDILFVVDNSGSMGSHQENLAQNINLFTSVLAKNGILDYNIAVITTDEPRFVGQVKVVNRQTPNADTELARNLLVGTGGSIQEMIFDPMTEALSQPLVSTANAGFLRPDAALIIVAITDTDDQSQRFRDPTDAYNFVLGLKGWNRRKAMSFGALTSGDLTCLGETNDAERLEVYFKLFAPDRSNIFSLCDRQFGTRLVQVADKIVSLVSSAIPLSRRPVAESIRVTYGSLELPKDFNHGWSYDPEENSIRLGLSIDWSVQPAGSRVVVHFDAAKLKEEER